MRIKDKNISPYAQKFENLGNGKRFRLILTVLTALLWVAILFFATLGYGAYLHKTGQTTYFKHTLLRIADLDFSFLKQYAEGRFTSLDHMDIDLKFKHLTRINYLRETVIGEGGRYIDETIKQEEFPATLTYNGQSYDVELSLTGKMAWHLEDPSKWSFEIKVKGDDTVEGMKRFGVLIPKSRGFLTDWLAYELMKERGLMGLRVDYITVSINGKSSGVFYLEERFDKYLIEHNRLREGIIFKLERDLSVYRESKLMESPDTRAQLLLLKRMWQELMTGQLPAEKFFDLEKMAKLFALSDLMNNRHALLRDNMRYYFNPMTGLIEPIAREWETLEANDPANLALFLEEAAPGSWHHWLQSDKVTRLIYDNLEFQRHYIREVHALSQEKILDDLFERNGKKIDLLVKKVYRTWPFYKLPAEVLYDNQYYLRAALHDNMVELHANFDQEENNRLLIHLQNLSALPLEITHLSWRDTLLFYPEAPIVLHSKNKTDGLTSGLFQFGLPAGMTWSDTLAPELVVNYNLLGLPIGEKKVLVYPWTPEEQANHVRNPAVRDPTYASFDFIEAGEGTDRVGIPQGKWTVDHDLVIPAGTRFEIEPGASIDLVNGAQIISYSPIFSEGEEDNPVLITSSDQSSRGIVIIRAGQPSRLSHTIMEKLSNPSPESGWLLPGALTFYESPVAIRSCLFRNNLEGDDFLNIVRSDFSMEETVFQQINADAFDCDFCTGTVAHSSFLNIGNDGIDVSGTEMTVRQVTMDGIGDKGLSVGEGSNVKADWIDIANAEIGITSKDRSTLHVQNVRLLRCRIGFTAFQKKTEFGPATIVAGQIDIRQSDVPFMIELNSTLTLDGEPVPAEHTHVSDRLYGVEFGKSSR